MKKPAVILWVFSVAGVLAAAGLFAFAADRRAQAARMAAAAAESNADAAREAARQARAAEAAAKAGAEAGKNKREAEELNRKAAAEKREAEKLALERAKVEANKAADSRKAAEKAADSAASEAAARKAAAEEAKAAAEKAKSEENAENAKLAAAAAALEKEKLSSEHAIAEAKLLELRRMDLTAIEQDLIAFKKELDERELALRPEKTVKDLVHVSDDDMVFGENGIARKRETKKKILPEDDPSLPESTRRLAKSDRVSSEAYAAISAAVRSNVTARLEKLYREALRDNRMVEASFCKSEILRMYPDWKYKGEEEKK